MLAVVMISNKQDMKYLKDHCKNCALIFPQIFEEKKFEALK
jgi:hypothetical protein